MAGEQLDMVIWAICQTQPVHGLPRHALLYHGKLLHAGLHLFQECRKVQFI